MISQNMKFHDLFLGEGIGSEKRKTELKLMFVFLVLRLKLINFSYCL